MEAKFVEDGQLLVLPDEEEDDADDIELQGIDVATWEKGNGP